MKHNKKVNNTFTYRDLKRLDEQKFVNELKEAPWDTADIVSSWYTIFNNVLESQVPIKHKRVKNSAQPKWFTNELTNVIKKRDAVLKKARNSRNCEDWYAFKRIKNKVCMLIRSAKESSFRNKFIENHHNLKKLWSLKNSTRMDVNKHATINQLKEGDKVVTDKTEIAELFNSFFITQPLKLLGIQSVNILSSGSL